MNLSSPDLQGLLEQLTPDLIQYMFPGLDSLPDAAVMASRISRKRRRRIESTYNRTFHSSFELEIPESVVFSDFIEEPDFDGFNDQQLNPRTQAIIAAWEKIEEEYGITIEELEAILAYKVKLSPLDITQSGKIILSGYYGKEVKMDNLSKAVYFYFLKHPKGTRLKELQDHEEEILEYYLGITGRDNLEEIRKSVHNLLDPYGNRLNESISRIKKSFRDILEDRIASFYYITGKSGGVRKIVLDRDLVIWNH